MEKKRLLSVDSLLLDLENPRLGKVESQSAALEALIKISIGDFRDMMRSILEDGLDPGDSFYVTPGGRRGEYIVLDGNRRISALKVLRQPSLIDGTQLGMNLKRSLVKLASPSTDIDNVECVIYSSRDDAEKWIRRRHGRDQGGERRIPWDTLQTQRFLKDRSITDIIDWIGESGLFEDAVWVSIKNRVEKNSSTLERIVESAPFKELLGFRTQKINGESMPLVSRDQDFVLALLGRIFEDIGKTDEDGKSAINTRNLNDNEQIGKYLSSIEKHIGVKAEVRPQQLLRDMQFLKREKRAPKSEATISAPKVVHRKDDQSSEVKPTTRPSPPRKTLAPQEHEFEQPKGLKNQALIEEASRIEISRFPMASAFLFRAVIEHALDDYMRKNKISSSQSVPVKGGKDRIVDLTLSERASKVIDDLEKASDGKSKDLNAVRQVLTSKAHPASIASLNDFHHNQHAKPAIDALRNGWDSAIPLFVGIFGVAK